jgi:hypothetical protein
MARRLYYQDSYGRVHRARAAERSRQGTNARSNAARVGPIANHDQLR